MRHPSSSCRELNQDAFAIWALLERAVSMLPYDDAFVLVLDLFACFGTEPQMDHRASQPRGKLATLLAHDSADLVRRGMTDGAIRAVNVMGAMPTQLLGGIWQEPAHSVDVTEVVFDLAELLARTVGMGESVLAAMLLPETRVSLLRTDGRLCFNVSDEHTTRMLYEGQAYIDAGGVPAALARLLGSQVSKLATPHTERSVLKL